MNVPPSSAGAPLMRSYFPIEVRIAGRWFAAFFFAMLNAAAGSQQPIAVEELLSKMASRYAVLTSYADTGTTYIYWRTGDPPEDLVFETHFARPSHFRFQWSEPHSEMKHRHEKRAVWANEQGAYHYFGPGRFAKDLDVSSALAGAKGISSGSSHSILQMLIPTLPGSSVVKQLTKPTLKNAEVVDGVTCYHITGDGKTELWIGSEDMLLRKIRRTEADGGAAEEEIRTNIKVNGPIEKATFDFSPNR
jgi:outer membrane lipoprotein-sorting protein